MSFLGDTCNWLYPGLQTFDYRGCKPKEWLKKKFNICLLTTLYKREVYNASSAMLSGWMFDG